MEHPKMTFILTFEQVCPRVSIWRSVMIASYKCHFTFLFPTFDVIETETWDRCQRVHLVQAHHLICNKTYFDYLGHFVTLTWGQILKLTLWCHAAYHSIRLYETDTMVAIFLLLLKNGTLFAKKKTWKIRYLTFDDLCSSSHWSEAKLSTTV